MVIVKMNFKYKVSKMNCHGLKAVAIENLL